jgi:formamidopyrimidine-DNA glycosylase
MPELPEVEVLVRHLHPLLRGKTIRDVFVGRKKVLSPTPVAAFQKNLRGAKFIELTRRGKYLLFRLRPPNGRHEITLLGHLGMTGRMFLAHKNEPLPKHAAVVLDLGAKNFIYEDARYFGRMTFDLKSVKTLGPEPLTEDFSLANFAQALKKSRQPIKVKLLDQSLIAGVGNIYASEALFRAGVAPRRAANKLTLAEVGKLCAAIRKVLTEAIACGSTMPLNFNGGKTDGLFYFGRVPGAPDFYLERLCVYDLAGKPCIRCGSAIKRIVQAARSTYFCPHCQKT